MKDLLSRVPITKIVRVSVELESGNQFVLHGAAAQSMVAAAVTELGDDLKGYIEKQPTILDE